MAENIISFVVFCMVAFIMIGIGVSQMRSISPVGFYTGEKPPKEENLTDVRQWNKKHGMMWIIYGLVILGSYFIGLVTGDTIYATIVFSIALVGGLLLMIFYHSRLKKQYLIKNKD